MADTRRRLGRGLDALLAAEPQEGERVQEVALDEVEPNPHQPRRAFPEDKLEELAASIREHGVVQPILVRQHGDRYQIIAGERRWRAARMAGLRAIPVVVRDMSDAQMMEVALVENLQRQDLNPMEEARAYQTLMDRLGLTQEELAVRLGKSRPAIANALRLLQLDREVQELVEQGKLSMGHARAVAGLESAGAQREVARRIVDGGLSVREAEALVKRWQAPAAAGARAAQAGRGAKEAGAWQSGDGLGAAVAQGLQDRLGARVRVRGAGGKGLIEIEFYGPEDLERIYEIIAGRPLAL